MCDEASNENGAPVKEVKEEDEEAFAVPSLPSLKQPSDEDTKAEKRRSDGDEKATEPPQKKMMVPPSIPLEYTPPPFAAEPDDKAGYRLEVLKDGSAIDCFNLGRRKNATFVTIGRQPECDIILEHPSISRNHAILQYGSDRNTAGSGKLSWFLYDLGSTHGSLLNKNRVPAKQYIKLNIGFVIKFGGSSRIFNLLGPEEEAEPEWDYSPSEMKQRLAKKALEEKLARQARQEMAADEAREQEVEGCSWGMDYDYDAGPSSGIIIGADGVQDEHLMEDREAFFRDQPVKALTKFFEREGFEMEFTYSETGATGHNHKWICTIELPVEVAGKKSLFASATVSTSKKDAQVQCATEACRMLDSHGVLRRSTAQSRLKRKTVADDDYYEEEEDEYLDRTGQIEAQREKRKAWLAAQANVKTTPHVDNYESLSAKLEMTRKEAAEVEKQLNVLRAAASKNVDCEDIDDFMRKMGTDADSQQAKLNKSIVTQRLVKLKHECQKLEKLVRIAKPAELPAFLKEGGAKASNPTAVIGGSSQQAIFRKMMQMRKERGPQLPPTTSISVEAGEKKSVAEEKEEEAEKADEEMKREEEDGKEEEEEAMMKLLGEAFVREEQKPDFIPEVDDEGEEEDAGTVVKDAVLHSVIQRKAEEKTEIKEEENESSSAVQNEDLAEDAATACSADASRKKRQRRAGVERKAASSAWTADDDSAEYGKGIEGAEETYATWLPPESKKDDVQDKLRDKFAGKY